MKVIHRSFLFSTLALLPLLITACSVFGEQPAIDKEIVPASSSPSETAASEAEPTEGEQVITETRETPQVDTVLPESKNIDDFFDRSWRKIMLRDPEWVLAEGLADVYQLETAELTNISEEYIHESIQLYRATLDELRSYDREELSTEQQISYDVYEWFLEDQIRAGDFLYHDYPVTYYPITSVHQGIIYFFSDLHPLDTYQDAQDYVTRLKQVDTKIDQLIEGLEKRADEGVIPPKFSIQWGINDIYKLANSRPTSTPFYQSLDEKLSIISGIEQSMKQELLEEASKVIEEQIQPAYGELAKHMEFQLQNAPEDIGVWQHEGGDLYYENRLNHFTTTDIKANEVHELGLEELERIHAEMRAIFDQLGYPEEENLVQLFDRVASDSGVIAGNDILTTYEDLIQNASQNLDEVFNVLPQAEVIVIESPIKGMYVGAPLDGSRPGVFHAGMGTSSEEYYAMPTLAYHEAVPGHHLQISIARETDLPLFRNVLSFSGYSEGWALYAEKLAEELGWYENDPYGNLGRLQAEAFRAARLVVDTGIHAKGWSFDKAEQFFTENTGFARGDAVNPQYQIARYSVWPGQSTTYKIGMLKIEELRQKAMDELGEQFDLKEFHSVLLENGSMPLGVLERVVDQYIESKK